MARTIVTFRIAPPLYMLNGARIPTQTPDGIYWTQFQIVEVGAASTAAVSPMGGARATLPLDPDGGLHNTIVTVESPFAHDVDRGPGQDVPPAQVVALRVLNRIIDHYRSIVGRPLLRRIEPRRASWMKYRVEYDDGRVRDGTNIVPTGLSPDGTPANIDPADDDLVQVLTDGAGTSQPTFRIMYLDALAEFRTAVYEPSSMTSALAHLFMSFEMLAWLTYASVGRGMVGDHRYEREFMQDDEGSPPPIRKVVKQIHNWVPSGFASKTKLNGVLDTLLLYRNDVMHGRTRSYPVSEVEEAFGAYERLAQWLDGALAAAGGPSAAGRQGTPTGE